MYFIPLTGHLNWLANNDRFQRLLPLATSGDGNCLLHAASLGIWGVHDRLLNLREAVHRTLSSSLAERTIKRRWCWYQWVKNMREGELVFSEIEWEKEWKLLLSLAAPRPRSSLTRQSLATVAEVGDHVKDTVETSVNQVLKPRRFSSSSEPRYESLEELHVFSLAHVLRRPIIVVADTVLYDFEGNAICPIPFGGVYLPIECDPAECCRIPLVLAYSSAHFSPIVAMELPKSQSKTELNGIGNKVPAAKAVIPLVDKALKPLLLPFAVDPGEDWDWSKQDNSRDVMKEKSLTSDQRMLLLKKYLDVEYIDLTLAPLQNNEQRREEESSKASGSDLDGKEVEGVDIPVQHSVAVVELPCRHQPSYYKELIERYIKKAKERFEFEQEMKGPQTESEMASIRCANDGCDMYGTVANNYLCTKCFQLQSNSIKEFKPKDIPENSSPAVDVPPPYHPPPYAEAVHDKCVFYPPSFLSTGSSKPNIRSQTLPKEEPTQCKAKECTFYGTADKNGFCSKCFQESQK